MNEPVAQRQDTSRRSLNDRPLKPLPPNLRWILDERNQSIAMEKLALAEAASALINAESHQREVVDLFDRSQKLWWNFHTQSVRPDHLDVPPPPTPPNQYVLVNSIRDAKREFEGALSHYFLQRQIVLDTFDLKLLAISRSDAEQYQSEEIPMTECDPLIEAACERVFQRPEGEHDDVVTLLKSSHDPLWTAPSEWLPAGVIHGIAEVDDR